MEEVAASAAAMAARARRTELGSELAQASQQAGHLRVAEASLAAQLVASARCGEETERKALCVARELVDASQGIAWLRAEVASQGELQGELQEARQRIGSLQ